MSRKRTHSDIGALRAAAPSPAGAAGAAASVPALKQEPQPRPQRQPKAHDLPLADPADPPQHDTTLLLRDGAELPVHSLILRLASPVLRVALSAPPPAPADQSAAAGAAAGGSGAGAGGGGGGGGRRLSLPDDCLAHWQLLWQALSPDAEDLFLGQEDKSLPKQIATLRDVLGLAHKYGIERVVRQACAFVQERLCDCVDDLKPDDPDEPYGVLRRSELRSVLLWLDTLQRYGLDEEYQEIYSNVINIDSTSPSRVAAVVSALQQEQPCTLLHSKLVTDLLLLFVPPDEEEEEEEEEDEEGEDEEGEDEEEEDE